MLTEEQKDYILMEIQARVTKAGKDIKIFFLAGLAIEFVLIMLVANKPDILVGFVISNIVMILCLVGAIADYKKYPYTKALGMITNDEYVLDVDYLTKIKEETDMTRHRRVIHTSKFVGCVYKLDGKMDVITDFLLDYKDSPGEIDKEVTVVKFPNVKDSRNGFVEDFSIIYLEDK